MSADAPLVSVGLPTFNGERHIAEALDSLVAQDYPNFEVLVSDNASSDGTLAIVERYAARDPRVRVLRNPANIGAPANFNRVFRDSTGPFFMWAADDDRWEPTYVTACLAALRDHPAAVLACTQIRFMDEAGQTVEFDRSLFDNPDLSVPEVDRRIERLLSRGGWYQIYGLMRREALSRTRLTTRSYGTDLILVVELALQGPFVLVPRVLFHYRRVDERSEPDRGGWHDAIDNRDRVRLSPYSYLQEAITQAISASSAPRIDKLRGYLGVLKAAYLRPTPLQMRIRGEVRYRLRTARYDRSLRGVFKYGVLHLLHPKSSRRMRPGKPPPLR
jgi:glycosyltransferase involved in cell wall biosynthesis